MASRGALQRAFALLASAAIAALPLASGLTPIAAAPAASAASQYPTIGAFTGSTDFVHQDRSFTSAGVADLLDPNPIEAADGTPLPPPPVPASVTAVAGTSALQGAAILRSDLSGSSLATTTLDSLHLETLPVEIPLSTIPIQRATVPHTWQELLAPTVLAGIPLQNVTWKQVDSLSRAGRPAALDAITMADVDWTGSVLADLPLAAFTFGGTDITTVAIPIQPGEPSTPTPSSAERWCYVLNQAQAGTCPDAAALTGQSLIGIGVRGAPLKNIPLKNIPLKNIDLSTSPLTNIPLKNIVLEVSPLKNIPLKNIDLSTSPLKNIPLKNIVLEVSPLKNIPLKNIDLANSPLKNIPLKNIDLSTSPLKNIPLKNIDLTTSPLKNIPLKNIDLVASQIGAIPLKNIDFAVAPLKNIPLKNIDLTLSPLKNIPLKNIDLAGAPLKNIPLKNIDFAVAPLKNIPLKNIDLAGSGLGAVPLDAILWGSAPLGQAGLGQFSFATGPLSTIPLASTATPSHVAGCAAAIPATCSPGETLGQAAAAGDILPTATLADIGAAGFAGHGTLADLIAALATGSTLSPTLGDIRLDLAGPSAPAVTLEALISAVSGVPDPVLGDLAIDLAAGNPTLGDLRLDLLTSDTGTTVSDLLALLSAATPDVLLGDLRIDLVTGAPALTIAEFIAALSSTVPDVLLGDLRLDLATGVDALVLDALSAFLLDPTTFAPYLLGALGTYTVITGHDITLGELGIWTDDTGADITLGQLAQYLDDSVSLSDVLLGLVPTSQFPYQDFPIASLGLNKAGRDVVRPPCGPTCVTSADLVRATLTYMEVQLTNTNPNGPDLDPSLPVDVEVVLPAGADFARVETGGRFSTQLVTTGYEVSTLPDGRTRVLAHVAPFVTQGSAANVVKVFWANAIQLGTSSASYRMLDPNGTVINAGALRTFTVQDGSEPNTPAEEIASFGQYSDNGRVPKLPVNPNGCSASSSSCAGKDPNYIDTLIPGFVSFAGDTDWYELPGVRAGSRISVDITNLPLDADLVLYGPSGAATPPTLFPSSQVPLPGQLVEDPGLGVGRAATSIAGQALGELHLDNGYLYPDDSFQAPMTPLSISQHSGTDPESVGVIAPVSGDATALVAGNYVVAVSGHNGAMSDVPYLLRAQVSTPTTEASCTARTFANTMPASPGSIPAIPAGANTVFLTDRSRLIATYGPAAADAIDSSLTALVAYLGANPSLGIIPAVVPVDAYPGVRPAYDAWDANPCSVSAANAVAAQVTGVLRTIHNADPGLAYVTIVGGDDIVPMGRVTDLTRVSNESEYASTFGDALNPVSAAEAASYTLTDDVYGDTSPTSIGNGDSLFVPRLAVGRLVEAPAEIEGQLASFVTNHGVLDTHTGLVAGYDFLADGSQAAALRLAVNGRTVDSHLIDQPNPATPWTQADLLASLFPAGGATPLVDSINAHYDHTALLPSAGNSGTNSQLETAADIASRGSAGQLAGRVLFTMGCHAGLSVPDAYVTGGDALAATLRGDWAQTLSAAGVSVYVANTGYGIGDTSSVAYSERLMGLFSRLLDGSLTAGQALAYAKQAYYGSLGAVGVYDTKILQQAAFYGLPFWRISPSATATPPPPPTVPVLPGTLATDPSTGLQALAVTEALTFSPVTTDRGTYWTATGPNGTDDPQVTQYQPIQPRTTLSVVTTGQTAHGGLVTSLSSHDVANVNPVLDTPTADLGASSPEARSDDSAWPGRLATITTSVAPYGRAQSLVLVPGRFLGSTSDGTGRQRLFDNVGVKVLYSPDAATDFAPPSIAGTSGAASGSTITFTVQASDDLGAVERVLVGYHDFDGVWRFTDLVQQGSTPTWTGTGTASHSFGTSDSVEYFVQAVDAAGNVGTASDKAAGFTARVPDTTPPTITASVSPAPNASGWIAGTSATVTFTCGDGGAGLAADACPDPITITTQGSTTVSGTVTDAAGNTASVFAGVQLDGTAPTISASVSPGPNAAGWIAGTSATLTFTCVDFGSGLAPGACPAPQTVTTQGATTVTASVTDIAGNTTPITTTVRLDATAPTISATITPAPNAAGWGHPGSAAVTFTCSDAGSGIAAGACPPSQTVSAEGVTDVSGSVADRAGNQVSIVATVRIDRRAPVVTVLVSGPPHKASCATSDALSGVATQATLTTTTARVNGIPTTTATCSGATDLAGNSGSATATFVAPMAFSGFFSPVDGPPVINTGKAGRTYPITFQLRDAQGAFISALPAVTSTTFQAVACSAFGNAIADPLSTDTSGNSGLHYDTTSNQYTYTWKTPNTTGCFVFRLGLADGATYAANFKLQ